jgi:hypothetical protein
VLRLRQVDDLQLLGGRLDRAIQRDRIRRRKLPAFHRLGLTEKPPGLGPPGLPALLALVRDQIVVSRNAVHGGGKRVLFQPAPVHPVSQLAY